MGMCLAKPAVVSSPSTPEEGSSRPLSARDSIQEPSEEEMIAAVYAARTIGSPSERAAWARSLKGDPGRTPFPKGTPPMPLAGTHTILPAKPRQEGP